MFLARNNDSIFRPTRIAAAAFLVTACLLATSVGRGATDPTREKQLRDALAMFDGDWSGEVFLWHANGTLVKTIPARRQHRWVGDVQIAVTAFELGPETISVRMRRWVEEGRLKAIVYWPVSPPETYRGQISSDGIAWLNEATGYRSLADRIIREDGVRKMEATSVETTLLTTDSEQVGIDAVFERTRNLAEESRPATTVASEEPPTESDPSSRPGADVSTPAVMAGPPNTAEIPPPDSAPVAGVISQPLQSGVMGPTGSVYVASDPPYVSFTIRSIGNPGVAGLAPRSGTTPVLVEDLPAGKYTATFQRPGWPDQVSEIEIIAERATSLSHRFEGGTVEISSQPVGARILDHGRLVGLTPVTLRNVSPGEVAYNLSRAGFHSTELRGVVEAGKSLALRASLEPDDSIVEVNELEVRPIPTRQVSPDIRRDTVPAGSRAVVELTVDRRGRARDAQLVSTTDELFGRLCLRAASRWRFEPGRVGDVVVATRVQIPFVAN